MKISFHQWTDSPKESKATHEPSICVVKRKEGATTKGRDVSFENDGW
jgi:hypothetical protein